MNKAIELVLSNIIPRHSGALPHELVDLTSSLLAQSRVKCSLNQEQETGRTYACAHLACESLKTNLNLSAIEPRPPVPPKVYKKLYSYFETTLTHGTPRKRSRYIDSVNGTRSGTTTPSKKSSLSQQKRTPGRNDTPIKSTLPQAQKSTPNKERSLAGFRTIKKGLRFEKRDEKKIPKWTAVLGREMCRKLGTVNAIPHVLAGVESLIWLDLEKEEEKRIGKWPALMIAVWVHVRKQLLSKKTAMTGEEFAEQRVQAFGALRELKEKKRIVEKIGEEGWQGWDLDDGENGVEKNVVEVRKWMKEITENKRFDMDWYLNIPAGQGLDDDEAEEDEEIEDENKDTEMADELVGRTLVREHEMRYGLGTMRQMKVDYLSEKRRSAYKVWEKKKLAEIARLLEDSLQEVDVDSEST